jgi:hypothetical protein
MHRILAGLASQRVRLRAVCGDGRLLARDLLGDRLGRYPEIRSRLFRRLCGRHHAAGGTLGILLPPSITMILYRSPPEQSLGRLFSQRIGPPLRWLFSSPAMLPGVWARIGRGQRRLPRRNAMNPAV